MTPPDSSPAPAAEKDTTVEVASPVPAAPAAEAPQTAAPSSTVRIGWAVGGLVMVVGLAWLVQFLVGWVPEATDGTGFGRVAKSIEYPVYAIVLGFAANALLSSLGLRDRMSAAFRTEFFIKVGLVLLGATIDFSIFVRAFGPAVVQACLLITAVFLFTWWLAGRLGIDDKLRALLATSLAVCGVSAAVAAAGAVQAKKEQLAFTATLVIVFAVPSIFLLPWLANVMGLTDAVTGAWIGGNIDTTAAVTAAGAVAGEGPLQIASIVKVTQNALLGVVAVLLTMFFAFKVGADASPGTPKKITDPAALKLLWGRFPKFVLGFLAASVVATILGQTMSPEVLEPRLDAAKDIQVWALTLAFVSIGLEFKVQSAKEAGWKPVVVFAAATVVNLVVGLALAAVLFGGFEM
ncbi:YeiH family protein [Brevibacterium yomogidense]|uniref:Inner membrane protein n=1 Tax=Brevibacterium yomogidense TaxID=946573 RepID=A0A1X6X069_9MICO|nr:YeiH family protein [Brevibacterium yomogidense]SLM91632.1 Inner membrane protein [Brevibacterium yomogidense]